MRAFLGWTALLIGAVFLERALWFHNHIDNIIRIPFVLGSIFAGGMGLLWGLRLLLVKPR